jgi:hypothetical protein
MHHEHENMQGLANKLLPNRCNRQNAELYSTGTKVLMLSRTDIAAGLRGVRSFCGPNLDTGDGGNFILHNIMQGFNNIITVRVTFFCLSITVCKKHHKAHTQYTPDFFVADPYGLPNAIS